MKGIPAANSDTVYTRTENHTLRALRSSEAQDGDADGDGSDGGDDGDQNDGGSDDGSNETDDGSGDGESSDGGDGDGSTDTSGGDGNESDDGDGSTEGGADADGDGQPGFTPIASLAAGALGLEWLRRRALGDGDGDEIEQQ
ncbi:hypothetical protein [Natronosalvus halobius]|uniref:hypothetical protein n=1 Tax=Natronosalvus halobius TaxID=2953746 RepID=UPI00209DE5D3|nr:hypothetical protein [Natronosalvus halobius]USZ71203.1 hypothetical protein NGM15_14120 [Natronosalvus halobius]